MRNLDLSQLKIELARFKVRRREYSNLSQNLSNHLNGLTNRRAVGQFLESFLAKAGVDVGKLDKMAIRNQSDLRRILQRQQADAARYLPSAKEAFNHGIDGRRNALGQLATLPVTPSYYVTLDTPFWIVGDPPGPLFVGAHIEPGNSWAKVQLNTDSGSAYTEFNFYFEWQNVSDYWALVNVASSLALSGNCLASAAAGFFSGDTTYLTIQASLHLLEVWNEPMTEPLPEQSQDQTIASLWVKGGGFWDGAAVQQAMFSSTPFDLSYQLWGIPPQQRAVFKVTLGVGYGFPDGSGDISDEVFIDFASNDHQVLCPFVQLEVLTPPPTAV